MHLLITLVCAVVGAWFFLGGLASFVVPGDAVPSLGTSTVIGGVLLVVAWMRWRGRAMRQGLAVGGDGSSR